MISSTYTYAEALAVLIEASCNTHTTSMRYYPDLSLQSVINSPHGFKHEFTYTSQSLLSSAVIKDSTEHLVVGRLYSYETNGMVSITNTDTQAVIDFYYNEDGVVGASQLNGSSLAISKRTLASKSVYYGDKASTVTFIIAVLLN